MVVKVELAPQKPLLKLFAIKAVGESSDFSHHTHELIAKIRLLSFLNILAGNIPLTPDRIWHC